MIDLHNVLVLAAGELLAMLGLILTGMSIAAIEEAKSIRQEARELQKATKEFKASGDRAYEDAKSILRDWERRSGQIIVGLVREEPPDTNRPH